MSRVGQKPVAIPQGVEVTLDGNSIAVKGPKGGLNAVLPNAVKIDKTDKGIIVRPKDKTQSARSFWGLSRSLVNNLVTGVSEGFEKKLELQGVGYRARLQGQKLMLSLGFSHDVSFDIPEGVKIECPSQTEITISGIDKQKIGQVAAEIRALRPPEPYKGKGVHYPGEYVFRKEGKKK